MGGKPYQSCLAPFENEILGLRRRRRPMSCAQIAEHMKEKHKIQVSRGTVLNFLKVRAKGFKPCKYAECIEPINDVTPLTTELPSLSKQTVSEIRETPKQPVVVKRASTPTESKKILNMQWSDVYNLTRMSDEEAAARNKRIEEKRKRLMEEQLKKENQ